MNNENLRTVRKQAAKSKFAGINTILPGVVVDLGLDRRMQEQALFSLWPSLLDRIYATRSMPLFIDSKGILVVAVENGSTAQELSFLKAKLLDQLQPICVGLGLTIKGMRFDLKRFSQSLNREETAKTAKNEFADKSWPTDDELAAFNLNETEIEEITSLKQKLQKMLAQLHLEQRSDNSANQIPERITYLVEKKLRFKKWCVQQNVPVCKQCAEPLPQFCQQSNIRLCPYCIRASA
jgi:hypothetical protein